MADKAGQKLTTYALIQIVASITLIAMLLCTGSARFGNDFRQIVQWWAAVFVLGLAFYPLASYLFRRFSDRGYLFSKAIGIAVCGWLVWFLCSLHVMRFTAAGCCVCAAVCAIANYAPLIAFRIRKLVSGKREGQPPAPQDAVLQAKAQDEVSQTEPQDVPAQEDRIPARRDIPVRWGRIAFLEAVFLALFLSFMYMKGFNPKAYGTEKMMDYGFMTSMFKSDYFPVEDFWFAGDHLNYYYFGQYLMTFMTKLSFANVAYGYNLALGMGFAFCASLSYALVYQVMKAYAAHRSPKRTLLRKCHDGAAAHVSGVLAALAVTIAGNGHYVVFKKLVPMFWEILQIPGNKPGYWFPNSTRYIGYMPETHDKTIHEYPSYSFILGDLHAHVINITFVLTLIAILFAFLWERKKSMAIAAAKRNQNLVSEFSARERVEVDLKKEALRPAVFAAGFLIGIFMMTNYWDFPIYFVVSGAVILISNAILCGFDRRTFLLTGIHAVIVAGAAFAVSLPFHLNFAPMANGIMLAKKHTLFYQLVILWGFPVLVVIGFVTALVFAHKGRKSLWCFLEDLSISDLFVLILGLCAIGLVITPEVIYMSDIYGGDYKRSNTMFKLVYQAFILFGLATGYILTRMILFRESRRQLKWGIVGLVALILVCGYFPTSMKAWFGDIKNKDRYQGLRADQYIYKEAPEDAEAIDWLNENVKGRPVVLEANGSSYTLYNRVSVLTGMTTVLGWHTHEWLWHNSVIEVDARADDIQLIYTSEDMAQVRALLEKYKVDYLFVGSCEYDKYMSYGMDVDRLKGLGEVVYEGYPNHYNRMAMIIKVR